MSSEMRKRHIRKKETNRRESKRFKKCVRTAKENRGAIHRD